MIYKVKALGLHRVESEIICYVLGSRVDCENTTEGIVEVIPRPYSTILRQAHARTFNLIKSIKQSKRLSEDVAMDEEIKEVLSQTEFEDFSAVCSAN